MTDQSQSPIGPDPDAVQRAKREIQGVLAQINDLAQQEVEPERFYEEYLTKVVGALAASGGAMWMLSDAGQLQLSYQINLRATGLIDNPIGQEQHGRLLTRALKETEGSLVAPHSGPTGEADTDDDHAAANSTDYLLVMAPVNNDQGVQGVVEIFQRPGARPATQRGYLRFLMQTCELAGNYLRSRRLSHLAEKQSLWEQLESFTRSAHEKLDIRETAYTIANEGRRLIGCDRVTVAVQRGGRVAIEAISGLDTFDKRSNTAALLTKAARAVTKTAEDVWYDGDTSQFAPQVEKAIDAYVDESHTKQMAILPMVVREDEDQQVEDKKARRKGPPKVLGALIVEQMVDSTLAEGYRQRVDVVRSHSTTAIGNAIEHQSLFLMPLWKFLGGMLWMFRGRTLPKTLTVLAAVGCLTAGALLIKQDFSVLCEGELKPKRLTNVFAQITGDVKEVYVKQNDAIEAGKLLAEQESPELKRQIVELEGRLAEAVSRLQTAAGAALDDERGARNRSTRNERADAAAEAVQIETQIEWLKRERAILEEQAEKLRIVAPTGGKVITWEVQDQLRRRQVQQGQVIMEIADLSEGWQIELSMPERRMGHVTREVRRLQQEDPEAQLRVAFYPATHPEQSFDGRVVKINTTAQTRGEEGNAVLMTVEFDQPSFLDVVTDPKVGAEIQAKVYCGRESIAYCWMHDLVEAFQSQVLFRFKP